MRVVEVLERAPDREFTQTQIATLLGIAPRTVYNWRRMAKRGPRKLGRPAYSQKLVRNALWSVGRELRRQGYPGWRAIRAGLDGAFPDRLIQSCVRKFKQKRRQRLERRKQSSRKRVDVLKPNVIWSMDSAHWPRRTEAQVVKDRASRKILSVTIGSPAHGMETIRLLEELKAERGLPLVLATDNGSAFVNQAVARYLAKEKVIHLRSLPRTPQHNSSVEIAIRELREQVGERADLLPVASQRLNERRLRASLGYLTPNQFDERNAWSYHKVRDVFFRVCRRRIRRRMQIARSSRAMRMEEREVIYAALEEHGWIRRSGAIA